MNNRSFTSFSELYRAAFAETDLKKKETLLAQVKLAIDSWQEMAAEPGTDIQKRTVAGVSETTVPFRQTA
jgi:hypothetical protein